VTRCARPGNINARLKSAISSLTSCSNDTPLDFLHLAAIDSGKKNALLEDLMLKRPISLGVITLAGLALAACGGNAGGGNAARGNAISMDGAVHTLPAIDSDLIVTATVPKDTIGEELPAEGLGAIKSSTWKATLGGFTQTTRSQSLGFPPGTKITIRNLSHSIEHTLDVVKVISKPPAVFPSNPKLSIPAKGGGKLEAGYASGAIQPGKSVSVELVKAGIYLIGCAFHYNEGMRDVLVVAKGAKPGPQATPPAH
jgi:plastocyanin